MNKEIKSAVVKTAKIAGVTCVALGGAALITSGAALKAMVEGAKYLKDTIKKIVEEEPAAQEPVVEAEVVETPAGEAVKEEAVSEESTAEETAVDASVAEAEVQEC